ncbi:MAG TPA: T9SS type A sorting domain-containing protein, partial [Saprospiraceae bacterium]|nr:T9SS type A sorting domain-containing protein [Saprospiraceae bacterium]
QCKFKEDVADGTIITNIAELTFDEKKETTNTTMNTIVTNTPCVTQSKDVNVCPSIGYTIGQTTYFEAGTYGEILPGIGSCDTFQMVHVSLLSEPSNGLTQQGNLLVAEGEGNNYYWYECNNPEQLLAATATYTPSQNGSYFVIVEGELCSSRSACVDFFLSNDEDLLKENIKIFPNPTLDLLNIESNIAIEQISIKNTLGTIQSIYKTNTSMIDLGLFANGIYFIEIKTSQGTLISKIIKQ